MFGFHSYRLQESKYPCKSARMDLVWRRSSPSRSLIEDRAVHYVEKHKHELDSAVLEIWADERWQCVVNYSIIQRRGRLEVVASPCGSQPMTPTQIGNGYL